MLISEDKSSQSLTPWPCLHSAMGNSYPLELQANVNSVFLKLPWLWCSVTTTKAANAIAMAKVRSDPFDRKLGQALKDHYLKMNGLPGVT